MRGIASIALVLIFLTGCPPPCPTQPHTDAERALAFHRSMRRPVKTLRAEARVEQWGEQGRIRGTVFMFVERPDRVRFDAMTQFGPAAILTSDGATFALTDLRENRFLSGPTCPQNIARLLGIPLSGEEVTLLLLGDSPRIDAEREEITCESGQYVVTRHGADGRRQELVFDIRDADREKPPEEQHLRLVRSQVYDADGDTEWQATFSGYDVFEDPESDQSPRLGVAMPDTVRFIDARQHADTAVNFSDIDLNVEVPDDAFRQLPRPGIPIENVTCDQQPGGE
jgi:hypothetical protein